MIPKCLQNVYTVDNLSTQDGNRPVHRWLNQGEPTSPLVKALEGDSKRKYFEHAGALLTADGTDDDPIKLEGVGCAP